MAKKVARHREFKHSYQTLINDVLARHVRRHSALTDSGGVSAGGVMRPLLISTAALALNLMLSPIFLSGQGRSAPPARADLPGPQQRHEPNARQDETDQLRAIAAALRAIDERQARAEAQRATHDPNKPDQVVWSNWAVVGMGLVAAVAAVRTLRAIEREVIETGKAAAAAKLSADIAKEALYVGERAYVHVSHYPHYSFTQNPSGTRLVTTLKVENTGRTPARITEIRLATFVSADDLPAHPPYPNAALAQTDTFLAAGDHLDLTPELDVIPRDGWQAIGEGRAIFYLVGYVDYIDTFSQRHRAGYGRMVVQGGSLRIIRTPGYNYDRLRGKSEGNDWNER
jgi:hypothetical protein